MGHDPRPARWLVLAELCGLGLLALWWVAQPSTVREAIALRLAVQEVHSAPPQGLWTQAQWLVDHRLTVLQGMAGLVGLASVIGLGEGMRFRAQDVLAGFRLTLWTSGVVGLLLVPGVVGAVLVLPWPLPMGWVAGGLAGLVGVTGFLMAGGRPYVA